MNKIKDYNLVCTNLNNRCHLTCVERAGSIVSVFLGKADFLCADPRTRPFPSAEPAPKPRRRSKKRGRCRGRGRGRGASSATSYSEVETKDIEVV